MLVQSPVMNEQLLRDPDTSILIVDDNQTYAEILVRMLSALGFRRIDVRSSLTTAFDEISAGAAYRLLFIDHHFPNGESGSALLERLRDGGLMTDRAAFLITSDPGADTVKRAVASGAIGIVVKPFERMDIERQLDKAESALRVESGESF